MSFMYHHRDNGVKKKITGLTVFFTKPNWLQTIELVEALYTLHFNSIKKSEITECSNQKLTLKFQLDPLTLQRKQEPRKLMQLTR